MNSTTLTTPCSACGGDTDGSTTKTHAGNKVFCSKSCLLIYGQKYRQKLREAQLAITRAFYG